MTSFSVDSDALKSVFKRRQAVLQKLQGPEFQAFLAEVGAEFDVIIEESFDRSISPAGVPWAPLKQSTLNIRANRGFSGNRPLDQSGDLKNSVQAIPQGNSILIQSSVPYGDVHQFGNPGNKLHGFPAPIPARPFLPERGGRLDLSPVNTGRIQAVLRAFLARIMEGGSP